MSKIFTSADQLIGHTPLMELTNIEKKHGLKAKLLAKLKSYSEEMKNDVVKKADKLESIGYKEYLSQMK